MSLLPISEQIPMKKYPIDIIPADSADNLNRLQIMFYFPFFFMNSKKNPTKESPAGTISRTAFQHEKQLNKKKDGFIFHFQNGKRK